MFSSFRPSTFTNKGEGGVSLTTWGMLKKTGLTLAVLLIQQMPGVSDMGVDLPLIYAVLVGLRSAPLRAAAWGAGLGFAQDLLSAGWVGPGLISKTLIGILSSVAHRHIYRERVLTQTFLIFLMAVLQQLIVWLLLQWDGSAPSFAGAFSVAERTVLGTSLVGAAACFWVVRFRPSSLDPATA
jgi:rod shape-determining protein MreD